MTRTPGWHPEETASQLPLVTKRYSRTSVGIAPKGRGPKDPWRRGAAGFSRASLVRCGLTVANSVRSFDTADSASLQGTDGREQCEWWYFVELTYHLWISRTIPLSHRQPFSVVFQVPIASVDTFGEGKCCPFFVLDVRGLVAEPPDKRLVTEDQRSLALVSQFVLVSGLVRNRRSGISVPRAFPIYTDWCPLFKLVPPLDRNRHSEDGVTNSL